ncbi:MAG: hypothetical protein Fur0018_09990 [Anaerolineales bacterium]
MKTHLPQQGNLNTEENTLNVLRWFIGLRFVMEGLGLLAGQFTAPPIDHPPGTRGGTLFPFVEAGLLFLLLSWPLARRKLGRAFLPLGITWAVLLPIIEEKWFLALYAARLPRPVLVGGWQYSAVLMVPLLLFAWQYGFRRLLGFIAGITVLDVGLTFALIVPHLSDLRRALPLVIGGSLTRGMAFLLVGYVITHLAEAQRAQQRSLEQANRRLVHYAATLEHLTISRERNRLARELHDTLAHTLSGIAVQLEAVRALSEHDPRQADGMLSQAIQDTRTGLTETRRALQALRASPLDDLGLTLALQSLAEQHAARLSIPVHTELEDLPAPLPAEHEQAVYRIVQEALENVARHARATQVWLRLRLAYSRLRVSIQDDGQGFAPQDAESGSRLGLRGLQERARMLGGSLYIESAPSQGTCIELELPYDSSIDL